LWQIRTLDMSICRDFVASEIAYQATYSVILLQSPISPDFNSLRRTYTTIIHVSVSKQSEFYITKDDNFINHRGDERSDLLNAVV